MINRPRFRAFFVSIPFLLLLLTSCASWLPDAHRQDVVQGNEIKREMLEKLHIGMKKSEVTAIIGNPTLKDPFHANRWDYIYRLVPGRQPATQSRLTLYFEGDTLVEIDASEYREPVPTVEEE